MLKTLVYLKQARVHITLAHFWALSAKHEANKGNDYRAMEFDGFYAEECAKSIYYIMKARKERLSK